MGPATKAVVQRLLGKGVLERTGRGIYLIRPFRSLSRPRSVSSAVIAATLLSSEPYYLGGLWAFSFHQLTQQTYGSLFDAYVTRKRRPRAAGNAKLIFHALTAEALAYGIESTTIEGTAVRVSDAERTVLDALDYSDAVGGVRAGLNLVAPVLERVDPKRLIAHAVRGSRASTCQRLGVLLEREGFSSRRLAPLRARVAETKSLLSLIPDLSRVGPVNSRWRVVENDGRKGDRA